jgi:SAM-dependent methyltransferase
VIQDRDKGRVIAVWKIFVGYFFTPHEHTVYRDPDLYDEGVLSKLSRRGNLARGVADVVEDNLPCVQKGILDIGAGTGILTLELASRGIPTTALDLYAEPLCRLREKATRHAVMSAVNMVQADMNESLPFLDDTFDVVTSLRINRYIRNFDHFLCEVGRVLRPGGVFVLPVFYIDAISWRRRSDKSIRQPTSVRRLKKAVAAAGLEIRETASKKYCNVIDRNRGQRDVPFYYKPTFIVATKPRSSHGE